MELKFCLPWVTYIRENLFTETLPPEIVCKLHYFSSSKKKILCTQSSAFNRPYGFEVDRVNFKTKRTIAHIFVAFSEKLEFIDITFNFSLTENQTVKLCDSALSRDLFPSDYHCLGDNNNRPIKWMPLESINQNRFSRASDVVSINKLLCVHK